MKKITILFLILLFFAPVLSNSLSKRSGNFEGTWRFTRDSTLNGVVSDDNVFSIAFQSHHNKFVGEYIGLDNDSIFEGETYTERTTTIINFIQYDATFYVVHAGKQLDEYKYQGTWYDVAGQSGDFMLEKIK